jgi:hypothetical protein
MLRKATVIAAMLATATALAACGGSSSPNSSTSTTAKAPGNNIALKLAECMRTHGVPDFPDPSSGGGFGISANPSGAGGSVSVDGHTLNVNAPAFQKAMQECQRYQPQGPPISGAQLAKIKQGALKMAACMRAHGVTNFPDPKVSTGPGGHGIAVQIGGPAAAAGSGRLDPRSPAFQDAQKICQPLMRVGPKAQRAGN